jgi:hypothetical protein
MSTTLTQAHKEWANRSADERFGSLEAMHRAATNAKTQAAVAKIKDDALRVVGHDGDIMLEGPTGSRAHLTNWAFSQLANRAGAPADYITGLPAPLAAECLNVGLKGRGENKTAIALMQKGDDLTCRAVTSDSYSRIWNADITSRLVELEARGPWQPAPAAFDGSRGLYLGDRDMFAFMVDNDRRIFETGPGGGLARGFFVANSEVGARRFSLMTFLYEYVCGNHRVWGAQQIEEVSIIHIGKNQAAKAFDLMRVELKKYAESSAADDEMKVQAARNFQIAANKDDVLDAVFKLKIGGLSRATVGKAYDLVDTERSDWYGSPRTAWGLAGGITEIARDLPNADARHTLDAAATKVMEMAF